MPNLNIKRVLTIFTYLSLSFSSVIVVSCSSSPPINVENINIGVNSIVSSLDTTEKLFYKTSDSVNSSYEELKSNFSSKQFVLEPEFSSPIIKKMEARHLDLSTQHKELNNSINKTNEIADKFFSSLEARAKENTKQELQEQSLGDIRTARKKFEERIEVAQNISSKLKLSIKDYDNILNFLQIRTGTKNVQEYLPKIDSVISEYEKLNQEVRLAINEGRQIITNFQGGNSQSSSLPDETSTTEKNITQSNSNSNTSSSTNEKTISEQANRPILGIEGIGLTEEVRQKIRANENLDQLNLDNVDKGVLVIKVLENSSASDAGIQTGDVILTLNGKSVTDISEVSFELSKYSVGMELPLLVYRNQQNLEIPLHLKENSSTSN